MITSYGELPDRLARDMSMAEQHEWLARRTSRRTILRAGAAIGAAALTPALWVQQARASGTVVYGKHLAYGVDPRTSMIVAFAVSGPFSSAVVRVRNSTGVEFSVPADVQVVHGSDNRYCRATLDRLEPDTRYTYAVLLDGVDVTSSSLHTATAKTEAFRFTAFGDQGTPAAAMLRQVLALDPCFHLIAGDLCYADTSGAGRPIDTFHPRQWDRWLMLNGPVAKSIPWMCAVGNHEMEPGFAMHGYAGVVARVPIGGASPLSVPVASVFKVGNVGFISLDSNDVSYEIPANRGWTQGAQTAWLASTLATLRAAGSGIDFVVAYMHHSAYCTNTAHGSEAGIREAWVPLFDRYSVDLVIS